MMVRVFLWLFIYCIRWHVNFVVWNKIKSSFNSKKSALIENDFCLISVPSNSGKHSDKEAIHIWQRKSVQEMQLSSNWRQSLEDSDPLAQSPSSDLIRSLALGGSSRSHLWGTLWASWAFLSIFSTKKLKHQ